MIEILKKIQLLPDPPDGETGDVEDAAMAWEHHAALAEGEPVDSASVGDTLATVGMLVMDGGGDAEGHEDGRRMERGGAEEGDGTWRKRVRFQ